ncbi:DHH family phosphoesterase [Shewanella sp. 3_MG-2023]|uniref:DHH family phosphoesterase n=1 Tax=Shewanella sp. 3_MG-2023 TaxID=3062635 RepID=UPI0026E44A73|nr:DHH family phosphoesterase [Shewanella sp. 3_MG-2023]MDO6776604.1 DHH family phosphoesterase [Shewanella sp. 3_MG-2023]
MHYDVFNGDADGIIALLQLRLAEPKKSQLITGVKRDIALLNQIAYKNDVTSVTVLDISMEKNLTSLKKLLASGISIFYCDHHRTGEVPADKLLETLIDLGAKTCTSLLINEKLDGKFVNWAITAAFGDNLLSTAYKLAQENELSKSEIAFLKELGTLINYNGYGASLDDLHIDPKSLYESLLKYSDPLMLKADLASPFYFLKFGYEQDYLKIKEITALSTTDISAFYLLPCEAWARRISGVFGNELANNFPNRAHAVLTLNPSKQDYLVSVRAPLNNRTGADEICSQFATGGGRKAAAGINKLPISEFKKLSRVLTSFYS